jgi:hypothetical protein|tara:strand:- start:479 stop:778 length:300 start_codon:yes stop_codon:yes gene_type:complete
MIFWIIYIFFSLVLAYLFTKVFNNFFIKFITFNIFLALFLSIWFVSPGSQEVAPILSIFLMETIFVENNGFGRLLRPFLLTFGLSSFSLILIWYLKFKN